jgi:enhancing lycopene biosynthesis protein 2
MGARHRDASVTDIVVDDENNIVTTPCYMMDARIRDVATGIDRAIGELVQRIGHSARAGA